MNRAALLATGLVVALGATLGVYWSQRATPGTVDGPVTVQRAAPQSFGALSTATVTQRTSTRDQSSPTSTETSGSGTTGIAIGEPTPGFTGYRYVYGGAPVPLDAATVDVLERIVDASSVAVGDFGLGLLSPGSFANATVQSVTVAQADGYAVYVDAVNGTVSISEVNPVGVVRDFPSTGTVPTVPEAQLAATASAFLAAHGIGTGSYGAPTVTAVPGGTFPAAGGAEDLLLRPDYPWSVPAQLTYPLRIEERDVVGYGGEPFGLSVSVDAQRMRVASVYNLAVQRYRASAYTAVTDFSAVTAVAERGGIYGGVPATADGAIELTLGTPDRVWLTLSRYDGSRSHELLVPALRFPVENAPAGYASAVVVPLAKDLLTPEEIKPVPLTVEVQGSSAPGSATE